MGIDDNFDLSSEELRDCTTTHPAASRHDWPTRLCSGLQHYVKVLWALDYFNSVNVSLLSYP